MLINNRRIYINLTCGLEVIPSLAEQHVFKVIRIQSSLIESKSWNKIFYSLDDDLLFHLALGYICIIFDGSCNKTSKVVRIAIPVIKKILEKMWLDKELTAIEKISSDYLKKIYKSLKKDTKRKLRYYKKFLLTDKIYLFGFSVPTKDGNFEYFKKIVKKHLIKNSND